uniref:Uncharacterized protein n=1 Tax=Burkholderia cepacia TaxID=292 RepID=J9RR36_BURCE|nr:hypothetical protein pYS10082 [Burkholderia cepacia]
MLQKLLHDAFGKSLRETLIKAALPGFFVREVATPKFASS